MLARNRKVWLVESVSLLRLAAALAFSAIAFQGFVAVSATIYSVAMVSDVVDGFLARRLRTETFAGQVLDLVSDKSLTIVSLLYAAARGLMVLPLAIIAARELVMIGSRIVLVNGKPVLRSSRLFGGAMATFLWGTTLFLVLSPGDPRADALATRFYWVGAMAYALNLLIRIRAGAAKIKASLGVDE